MDKTISLILFWSAVGISISTIATRYMQWQAVLAIGLSIVVLVPTYQFRCWLKKKRRKTHSYNNRNTDTYATNKRKKALPRMRR